MSKFVIFYDTNGNAKVKLSEEWIKKEKELTERKERIENERFENQQRLIKFFSEKNIGKWNETIIRRFVKFIDVKGDIECWNWLGTRVDGYGQFNVYRRNREQAHRFMFVLIHGEITENKPYICHSCDNPACVNPNHLFCCTTQENMDDAIAKGRFNVTGEKNPTAVINQSIANEIREKHKKDKSIIADEFAKEYGLSKSEINYILNNQTWIDPDYKPDKRVNPGKKGEKHPNSKTTVKDVSELREKYKNGQRVYELSKKYKLAWSTVDSIVKNKTWVDSEYQKWLDENKK